MNDNLIISSTSVLETLVRFGNCMSTDWTLLIISVSSAIEADGSRGKGLKSSVQK